MSQHQKGFTLVEVMIVLAVVSIVTVVSITHLSQARIQANEARVQSSMRTIQMVTISYRSVNGAFPTSLADLGPDYLGGGLHTGTKGGYNYQLAANGAYYNAIAIPGSVGVSGMHGYCTDANNILYVYNDFSALIADGNVCPSTGTVFVR